MVTAAMKLKDTFTPWKESYNQPRQHIKKQRHHFANKGPSSQSYDFSIVMYECESWTIRMAEHWRTDAFELWCWRRLLRIPWTARRSNQSILKEINPEYSLWATSVSLFTFMHWRRKWQPTPVFLPGGSQGQGSLVGCRPWGLTESDTTEVT